MRIAECGIEEVVSGQSSVVSRVFGGYPQGSVGEMWISDCGMRNGEQITRRSVPNRPADGEIAEMLESAWQISILGTVIS